MRASQYLIATLKETPSDAEVISHQLMLRAGLIRKLASGLYTWLPLGLKVIRNVETIIREELDKAGALEILMPVVQPAEIWQESGRWQQYGPELMRMHDRHQREFCLGPTHEEVVTQLAQYEINSYKQLPINFYQIQTKFRDEVRPRFGVMRSREFIMKDAYSFHIDQDCLQKTYEKMYTAYSAIFDRIGLNYRAVLADTGSIGGSASHEFHVLAKSGEDEIAFSSEGDYAANVELAPAAPFEDVQLNSTPGGKAAKVDTPKAKSITEVASILNVAPENIVKTLIVQGDKDDEGAAPLYALALRGDHQLNAVKAEKLPGVASPLTMASEVEVKSHLPVEPGYLGPIGLNIPLYVDKAAASLSDFVCGANEADAHLQGANWQDLTTEAKVVDIRNVQKGDASPSGSGTLDIARGIEVGHIFQLGTKYSKAMKATVLNENGKDTPMVMGCYGIGVTRIVAAAIEQNHDEKGIIWPKQIAPFQLALVPINLDKSEAVKSFCESLYADLQARGLDILFMDEAKARLGGMLANTELMGIPYRVVVGDKGLAKGLIEFKGRQDDNSQDLAVEGLADEICRRISN